MKLKIFVLRIYLRLKRSLPWNRKKPSDYIY